MIGRWGKVELKVAGGYVQLNVRRRLGLEVLESAEKVEEQKIQDRTLRQIHMGKKEEHMKEIYMGL